MLRSDRDREYTLNKFTIFYEEHGIIHEVTAPYFSQSNDVAEQKKRTLLDMVNAMIISFEIPKNLWGEALLTSTFILNRISSKDKEKASYEYWKGHALKLSYFQI